jgi:hypothetical protein
MIKLYIDRGTEMIEVSLAEYYDLHAQVMLKNDSKEELENLIKLIDTGHLTAHGQEIFKRVKELTK